jgi:hypothetical protein
MKLRHAAALALLLVGFMALLISVLVPSIRWEAVWTMIGFVLLEILGTVIICAKRRT